MIEVLKKMILYTIIIIVLIIAVYFIDCKLLENQINSTRMLFLALGTQLEIIKNVILKSKTVFVEKEEKED